MGDPQASRVCSGPPAILQQRGLTAKGKLTERKIFIINKKNVHLETPSKSHQLQRPQVDKATKMGRNQCKKDENTKNQNASPPPKNHNSSPARDQRWMENESDELTETGFRSWVITNFSELKEHVLTQCRETKNLEKKLDEMLTRINSLEKNINNLMELKNTAQELHEPSFHKFQKPNQLSRRKDIRD